MQSQIQNYVDGGWYLWCMVRRGPHPWPLSKGEGKSFKKNEDRDIGTAIEVMQSSSQQI
jgi:hypothetical protein